MNGFNPKWPAPPCVRAFVTERSGGVSTGAYASLNLAQHVGDDRDRVTENRRRLSAALGLPGEPHWLEQVHGATVLDLDAHPPGRADGAVTGRPGVVCAVMTADCLPVLLCDVDGAKVAVAHAGWRGLAAGVLRAAVEATQVPPARLLAWLGPAIGPAAYEVGAEVRAAFLEPHGADAGFEPNERGRFQANLYDVARRALRAAGVEAIFGGGFCTFEESSRFFSHRREAPCGRMATLIWLDP